MRTWSFTLTLEGAEQLLTPEVHNALFEAGCGDALFSIVDGVQYAEFDRVAPSLDGAVSSAVAAIESAIPGVRVVRIEPEPISATG